MTAEELTDFINESLKNRNTPYKRVIIGKIGKDAHKRIEKTYGKNLNLQNINIDNFSIIHALTNLNHNLQPEDILLAVNVINTSTDITLSNTKHQNNDVLTFKKNIDGEITFLTEVRVKNGYLLVFNLWRQKKARSRKRPDAAEASSGSPRLTS